MSNRSVSLFAALMLTGLPLAAVADTTSERSVNFTFSGNGSGEVYGRGPGWYQTIDTQATSSSAIISINQSSPSITLPIDTLSSTASGSTTASNSVKLNEAPPATYLGSTSGSITSKVVVNSPSQYFESGVASFYNELAFKPVYDSANSNPLTLTMVDTMRLASDNPNGYGWAELRIYASALNPAWNATPDDRSDDTLWWTDADSDGVAEFVVSTTSLYLINTWDTTPWSYPSDVSRNLDRTFTFALPDYSSDPNFYLHVGFSIGASAREYGSEIAAIPEPETYALLLAGLGLLGFMARRRKQ